MCLNFHLEMILRAFYVDWIMVEVFVLIAFMSVFFTSRKTAFHCCLDTFSIPPRYLVSCRASQAFSYRNLDTSSTPSGSIEKSPVSSIASRHLADRSSFCSGFWCLFLDTSSTLVSVDDHSSRHLLDRCLDTSSIPVSIEIY